GGQRDSGADRHQRAGPPASGARQGSSAPGTPLRGEGVVSVRDLVFLSCKEMVELVTDYQCDALDTADRVTFEQHLFGCTWCMTYLKQLDRTIELTAQLGRPAPVEPAVVETAKLDTARLDTAKLAALFR